MTPQLLLMAYLAIGACFAVRTLLRTSRDWSSVGSASAMLLVWPLWAPFAARPAQSAPEMPATAEATRILEAVALARRRANASGLGSLLDERDEAQLRRGVLGVCARVRELESELERVRADPSASSLRLQCEERVRAALERDRHALAELGDLAAALATELALASCGHSDEVSSLIAELTARLEALAEAA